MCKRKLEESETIHPLPLLSTYLSIKWGEGRRMLILWGPYFKSWLIGEAHIRRGHLFDGRGATSRIYGI